MKKKLLCLLFCIITGPAALAQVNAGEKGKISGLAFSDYYWIVSHHTESLENHNGFWFRRIYLAYDHRHSNSFSARLRFEMSSAGDFSSGGSMTPFVKDAYLKWENDQHAVYAGISGTPTFALVESVWGYRAVEKTAVDLQRMGSSRDFGIAAKGSLGQLNYHAMIGNGNSTGPDTGMGKAGMLSLSYQVTKNWIIEGYADRNDLENGRYRVTLQGFTGFDSDKFAFGLLYVHQFRENGSGNGNQTLRVASAFARATFSSALSGFLRADRMLDPNPDGERIAYLPFSDESKSTLLIGGLDINLKHDVHLIPNIEAVLYEETTLGVVPGTDIIPRLTLFYQF